MNIHPLSEVRSRLPPSIRGVLRKLFAADVYPPRDVPVAIPLSAGYLDQAEQCRKLLRENLAAFYLPRSVDFAYGGYFELLDGTDFRRDAPKHLVLQSRQLWFFSNLIMRGVQVAKAREAAIHGFRFLTDRLCDSRNGGFYLSASREGRPIDRRKSVYALAFALFGLVAFHRATGSRAALDAARLLYRLLTEKAHDHVHGGILEWCSENWVPLNAAGNASATASGIRRTSDTYLHLLEACLSLYTVYPDNRLRQRLVQMITNLTSAGHAEPTSDSIQGICLDRRVGGSDKCLRASYGHDLEAVWIVLDAVDTLGLPADKYIGWAEAVCRSCLKLGFDKRRGGFFRSGLLARRADDRRKIWWVQAEAMVALLNIFRLTKHTEYYDAFALTFQFVQRHQVAEQGGWWAWVYDDGSRKANTARTGKWQGAYHSGRALMLCSDILTSLAGGQK